VDKTVLQRSLNSIGVYLLEEELEWVFVEYGGFDQYLDIVAMEKDFREFCQSSRFTDAIIR